jgi:hypothetical protein
MQRNGGKPLDKVRSGLNRPKSAAMLDYLTYALSPKLLENIVAASDPGGLDHSRALLCIFTAFDLLAYFSRAHRAHHRGK